ncbi:MAG TPA: regulatory iron-sulfur-containing complex subunit RicT [Syntrophorhabdaceae bacterium]|nr:regulatory iron-sulfur-containing complex subunit RicT [Syntrophorhabdaceae bacterium]
MKSCYVNIDRLTGVLELQAVEDIKIGDFVISELDKGTCLGTVVSEPVDTVREDLPKIGRKATEQEVRDHFQLKEKEKYAFDFCKRKIEDMGLPMKLLSTEYLFGGTKLLFYFISENRVDFRELVKELAKEFKIRIELRQVGVRDEAKIVGGLGNCGNTVCCRRFLNNFSIVSIKMVKEQGLALNPSKISGICGRLMCCLAYEYETYLSLKKNFPKIGKRVKTPQGEGKVVKHNALGGTLSVQLDEGKEITLALKDISAAEQPRGAQPAAPVDKGKAKTDNGRGQPKDRQQNPPDRGRQKNGGNREQTAHKQSNPGDRSIPRKNNGQKKDNGQTARPVANKEDTDQ